MKDIKPNSKKLIDNVIKMELIGNIIEKRKYLQTRGEDEGY
jgi:hypothetical protein